MILSLLGCNCGTYTYIYICVCVSADLGGRVGWLPKAERVKTLFLSSLEPQNAGGGVGGGGGSLQVPTSEAAVSADTQEVCEKIVV